MPLESLLELVKTLSDRIDQHGPALRQSEALTRYTLIDPLLRELGWDTSDPDMVIPEYRVPNNQIADYVLQDNGHPVMVVESKKLDEPLQSGKALDQGILYCAYTGSKHFVLTDGRRWEIYEAGNTTPVISFDMKENTARVCLKALALWRHSVESGDIAAAQTSVVEPTQPQQGIPDTETQPIPTPVIQTQTIIPVPENGEWQPLSGFNPEPRSPRPIEMMFPDNTTSTIRSWGSMIVEVTRWLVNNNFLSSGHFPIEYPPARTRYIVHTTPTHPSELPFGQSETLETKRVGKLYVEINTSLGTVVRQTRHIIESVDQHPAQFKVRLP